MATHSSTFAWEIPWIVELFHGLVGYSPWGRKRVPHNSVTTTNNNNVKLNPPYFQSIPVSPPFSPSPPFLIFSQCSQLSLAGLKARINFWKQGGLLEPLQKKAGLYCGPTQTLSLTPVQLDNKSLVATGRAGAVLWSRESWGLPGLAIPRPSLCITWGREAPGMLPPTPSPTSRGRGLHKL